MTGLARAGAASAWIAWAACGGPPQDPVPPPRESPAHLILHDWYGSSPVATPAYVSSHREFLDDGTFDGVALYLRRPDLSANITRTVLGRTRLTFEEMAGVLAPVRELRFRYLKENFAAVVGGDPPDFMDDWSAPIANFGALAAAARNAGLRGIYFDNECYDRSWTDYPNGVAHREKSLALYQEQARLRGRQVMESIVAAFPEITVILLHGPYVSELKAPGPLFPKWHLRNELLGPFFAGFVEGAGDRATVVDGGELYHLRSGDEFRRSHEWRRTGLVSADVNCAFIPPELRKSWNSRVSLAFGVMDQEFRGRKMNPDVLASTLARALGQTDRYVWMYVEGPSFLKPPAEGGAPAEWRAAVRRGRSEIPQKRMKAVSGS